MRGLTGLLSDEVQLFVHLLLDEADLVLLLLGDISLAWIKYIHSLEIECTDTAHEGFLQVLLKKDVPHLTNPIKSSRRRCPFHLPEIFT